MSPVRPHGKDWKYEVSGKIGGCGYPNRVHCGGYPLPGSPAPGGLPRPEAAGYALAFTSGLFLPIALCALLGRMR